MKTQSNRLEFAKQVVDKYKIRSTTGTAACNNTCILENIAQRLHSKVEQHTNILGIGAISIKKKWLHGEHLLYHRGSVNVAPAIEFNNPVKLCNLGINNAMHTASKLLGIEYRAQILAFFTYIALVMH